MRMGITPLTTRTLLAQPARLSGPARRFSLFWLFSCGSAISAMRLAQLAAGEPALGSRR